jgi:protoheme IX farnesyltransferase
MTDLQPSKGKDILAFTKLRLASLVIFSAVLGYVIGADQINWLEFSALALGGTMITAASNGMNQILERLPDGMMERTRNRPLPTGRMSQGFAWALSLSLALTGALILWIFTNPLTCLISILALVSYVLFYTPLKSKTPLAVFVGAFPGAAPPLLGYVAATGTIDAVAVLLFSMQFMWQFPHFWAIAWVAHDDYEKGGYKLLPFSDGRSKKSAFQIFVYSLFLIPVSLLPWALPTSQPMVGDIAAVVTTMAGAVMAWYAYKLYRTCDVKEARRLMFASFFYLPLVQLFYVIDKF